MKEDILEQIVEDYLHTQGYFTISNVKFRPADTDDGYESRQDSVHSDVDVVGINPLKEGADRVVVVSCKSWQTGFWPRAELEAIRLNKVISGRERWRAFRELANDKWAAALKRRILQITGSSQFTYWTAVARLGAPSEIELWTSNAEFQKRLTPHIRVIALCEMVMEIYENMGTTPAGSEVGRLVQVLKAAGVQISGVDPSKASVVAT